RQPRAGQDTRLPGFGARSLGALLGPEVARLPPISVVHKYPGPAFHHCRSSSTTVSADSPLIGVAELRQPQLIIPAHHQVMPKARAKWGMRAGLKVEP